MKTALIIIGVILAPAILFLCALLMGILQMKIETLFGFFYKKNESEQRDDSRVVRTRFTSRQRALRYIFLAVFALIFIALDIIAFLTLDAVIFTVTAALGLTMTAIPIFFCLQVWLSYEIISDDGIAVRRVFSNKHVKYSEMSSFSEKQGIYQNQQDLYVYDTQGKCLIFVRDKVGMKSLVNALEQHGILREA